MDTNRIITGNCLDALPDLPAESVNCVMTSPPYWNLRDYGHADQLGREADSATYVENIADVMDEVKRVLRDDGSLWLNLGDTYDDKDLQQIPARVALELQGRGWILRNRVTWVKPNPMPQSVKDRLNDTTEAVFHFVKNKKYWYDLDAIREAHAEASVKRQQSDAPTYAYARDAEPDEILRNDHDEDMDYHSGGKNPGDVFEVTTKPFPDAHFAVYPPELCEKPIKATCPPTVCAACGAPYERETEVERSPGSSPGKRDGEVAIDAQVNGGHQRDGHDYTRSHISNIETVGWSPNCNCDTDDTKPGIVLDPFAGAGTTLLKAKELRREYVGIELNPEYADMARARVGLSPHDPANIRDDDNQRGLEAYE